jgi:hypothetical protein
MNSGKIEALKLYNQNHVFSEINRLKIIPIKFIFQLISFFF